MTLVSDVFVLQLHVVVLDDLYSEVSSRVGLALAVLSVVTDVSVVRLVGNVVVGDVVVGGERGGDEFRPVQGAPFKI